MTLTVEQINERVKKIDPNGDSEKEHLAEDELYLDTLRAIADGAANPVELAAAALTAHELDFPRWYA